MDLQSDVLVYIEQSSIKSRLRKLKTQVENFNFFQRVEIILRTKNERKLHSTLFF